MGKTVFKFVVVNVSNIFIDLMEKPEIRCFFFVVKINSESIYTTTTTTAIKRCTIILPPNNDTRNDITCPEASFRICCFDIEKYLPFFFLPHILHTQRKNGAVEMTFYSRIIWLTSFTLCPCFWTVLLLLVNWCL